MTFFRRQLHRRCQTVHEHKMQNFCSNARMHVSQLAVIGFGDKIDSVQGRSYLHAPVLLASVKWTIRIKDTAKTLCPFGASDQNLSVSDAGRRVNNAYNVLNSSFFPSTVFAVNRQQHAQKTVAIQYSCQCETDAFSACSAVPSCTTNKYSNGYEPETLRGNDFCMSVFILQVYFDNVQSWIPSRRIIRFTSVQFARDYYHVPCDVSAFRYRDRYLCILSSNKQVINRRYPHIKYY